MTVAVKNEDKFSGEFTARSLTFIGGDEPKLSVVMPQGHAFIQLSATMVALLSQQSSAWVSQKVRDKHLG